MDGYLGQNPVNIEDTPFKDFTASDWVLYYIERYSGIDGSHHKDWVFDQVARILKGTPIEIELAKWDNGHEEYRIETGEPSQAYHDWVKEMLGEYDEENDEYEYGYETGIAP